MTFLSNIQIIPEMDPQLPCPIDLPEKDRPVLLGCHFHQGRLPPDGRYYPFREIFWKEGKRCDHLFTPRLSKHPTFGRLMVLDKYKIELYNCQMYVPRLLLQTLQEALKHFPAVLITGPRQAGKTTFLVHELGERSNYVSFDDPLERGFALSDPNGFLDRFEKQHVILDEIQYAPEILPYLKMRIDRIEPKQAGGS